MKCEDCKYWDINGPWVVEPEDGECQRGACRKDSPKLMEGQLAIGDDVGTLDEDSDGRCADRRYLIHYECVHAVWPVTREHDWCGEFEVKEV